MIVSVGSCQIYEKQAIFCLNKEKGFELIKVIVNARFQKSQKCF